MIPKSTNADWNSFTQHISLLYAEQINNLKKLTHSHLEAGNNEQKARFIKVAYVDHYDEPSTSGINDYKETPRVVLWEVHPAVRGLDLGWNTHVTTVGSLKNSLRGIDLPPNLGHMQTEFYFASMHLRNRRVYTDYENLRLYLIFYCDKIYAMPLPQSTNETWQKYKDYFKKAQDLVLANPILYTELCRNLKSMFADPNKGILEDDVYRHLVLLRSLPESLAYSPSGHVEAAKSVRELLALLDLLEDKEKFENEVTIFKEVIYNVINALEWLAYLVPKMHEVELQGQPLYEELVDSLEKHITERRYNLAIRLEAACALGWASVSSIAVATYVHQSEKSPKSRIHKLNSNVLRQVAGVAYLRASFTLVSFGPARATPGAEKMIPPGGYLHPEQPSPPNYIVTRDYARQAASDVVYNELASSVRGNIPFLSVIMILAALWLGINALIATVLLNNSYLSVVACLLIPPTILMLLIAILLSVQLGRGYWLRIVIIWTMLLILAISPWIEVLSEQRIFVILGAIVALVVASVGPIGTGVTLITGILATLKWLRSRSQRRQKTES
jgi:hypothetical protein